MINQWHFKIDLIKLFKKIFLFRFILGIISFCFYLLNIPFIIIKILIVLALIWGFYKTENKKLYIFKLSFICISCTLLTMDLSLFFHIDLKHFLIFFLFSYVDNYSEIDPDTPLLGELHETLLRLDLTQFNEWLLTLKFYGGGGGDDPDLRFISIDDNSDEETLSRYVPDTQEKEWLKDKEDRIEFIEYNNNFLLDRPKPSEMAVQKDIISNNKNYLEYKLRNIYQLKLLFKFNDENAWNKSLQVMKNMICHDIKQYNLIYGAKIWYEKKIPMYNNYHMFWTAWFLDQNRCDPIFMNKSEINYHFANFLIPERLYFEAIDNQLIIGTDILALIYIHNNLLEIFNEFIITRELNWSEDQVYKYIWEKRGEAINLYSKYYDKHNEEWVKYMFKYESREEINDFCSIKIADKIMEVDFLDKFKLSKKVESKSILAKSLGINWVIKPQPLKPISAEIFENIAKLSKYK